MVVNTLTVSAAVTPAVINTYLSHYLNRKPLRQKPTAHISYHEGLVLVRRFLHYASLHTVEELQAFTRQWVPVPRWIKSERIEIPKEKLSTAADFLQDQLGPAGIEQVGGKLWWQWRRDNGTLKAEWIEMRNDYNERISKGDKKGKRIILYVHGGAYYFGSVDEHRYQMQRHARKLQARILAPRYRLAPQFPFPCGLNDCLAAYLYLLDNHDPSTILLAGDSAGGGMVLSMLVTIRDRGIPLPAGAILLSPWVDLTHSFPSLGGSGEFDYIPAHGFLHKPSVDWPPPNSDDMAELKASLDGSPSQKEAEPSSSSSKDSETAIRGYSITGVENATGQRMTDAQGTTLEENRKPSPNKPLSLVIDGNLVEIKDQIQMYAANHLLTHPMVSPALQPSLGGLPPLLIQVGGGELLRDEQIYIAHKAASPADYLPPSSAHLSADFIQSEASKYPPTNVQLQVWDDLCHVAPTLSFTRPAKFMYRSIAQFGAWALAKAQQTTIEIQDDDDISIISSSSASSSSGRSSNPAAKSKTAPAQSSTSTSTPVQETTAVGRAGDFLPPFENHMIRQRINRHGIIYPLPEAHELPALQLPREQVGIVKDGPVRKWMTAQASWNKRFAKEKRGVQKTRLEHMKLGFEGFEGDTPPLTALAGRRVKGMQYGQKKKRSWGMSMWSVWGSKHDIITLKRQTKTDIKASKEVDVQQTGAPSTGTNYGTIRDEGQADTPTDTTIAIDGGYTVSTASADITGSSSQPREIRAEAETVIPESDTLTTRPTRDGIAYPFKLALTEKDGKDANASTLTLTSVAIDEASHADNKSQIGSLRNQAADMTKADIGAEDGHQSAADAAPSTERPQTERFYTAHDGL